MSVCDIASLLFLASLPLFSSLSFTQARSVGMVVSLSLFLSFSLSPPPSLITPRKLKTRRKTRCLFSSVPKPLRRKKRNGFCRESEREREREREERERAYLSQDKLRVGRFLFMGALRLLISFLHYGNEWSLSSLSSGGSHTTEFHQATISCMFKFTTQPSFLSLSLASQLPFHSSPPHHLTLVSLLLSLPRWLQRKQRPTG
jgi:hypothetical protein